MRRLAATPDDLASKGAGKEESPMDGVPHRWMPLQHEECQRRLDAREQAMDSDDNKQIILRTSWQEDMHWRTRSRSSSRRSGGILIVILSDRNGARSRCCIHVRER